jgi:hypothetical protein
MLGISLEIWCVLCLLPYICLDFLWILYKNDSPDTASDVRLRVV